MNEVLGGFSVGQLEQTFYGWPLGRPAPYSPIFGQASRGLYGWLGAQSSAGNSITGGGSAGSFSSQSVRGGGAAGSFNSHSVQGGGKAGSFGAQSIQGGGSVSAVPITVSDDHNFHGCTYGGFFFKVSAAPVSSMTLLDLNGGTTGYLRVKLTSAMHVVIETSHRGTTLSLDLTPSTVVIAGTFYWVAWEWGSMAGSSFAQQEIVLGQCVGPGGSGDGQTSTVTGNMGGTGTVRDTISCVLGWGVTQTSAYLNFPNTSGNELSKLEIGSSTSSDANSQNVPSAPTSDLSAGSLTALYLCRDTAGTTSGIVDSTANAFNLTAGPNGLLVVTDGPYA